MGEIYNVVIIGAGNISSGYDEPSSTQILTHAHALKQSPHFNLLGFYDINGKHAEEAACKWKTKVICNLDSLQNDIDIICCAVPDEFHYSVLREVYHLPKLKAVLCEKPITRNAIQAKGLVELYNDKIPIIVNYTRRFLPEFAELKNWIEKSGEFIVGNCFYGKGIFHNCSHMLNILEFFWGDLELISVDNVVFDYFEDDPSASFVLKVGMGKLHFHPIDCNIATIFEFDLFFKDGRVKYSDEGGTIEYYNIGESSVYAGELNYILSKSVRIDRTAALMNLYQNVYNVLDMKQEVFSTGRDAYRTICLCEDIKKKLMENKDETA